MTSTSLGGTALWPLFELEKFTQLEGYKFKSLPTELKNALEIRPYVRVVTLLKQSDKELKYEVFERLNTGGERLFPQEIRNVAFRGPLNDLLFELSKSEFFRAQLKIIKDTEPTYLQMQDVEYVLRYFTMLNEWQNFSGDYRRSMDRFMEENRDPGSAALKKFEKLFLTALSRCSDFWGENSFKRFDGADVRNQFLAGMFDAQMVAATLLTQAQANALTGKQAAIKKATQKLFDQKGNFESWVRYATNTKSSVKNRVQAVLDTLKSIA